MIATGSIGAAVQGLGACSMSGDELTELLAGITGTEVVSVLRQLGSRLSIHEAALFPELPAEGGIHLQPGPQAWFHVLCPWGLCGLLSPALVWRRASVLMSRRASSLGALFCQVVCRVGVGVWCQMQGCSHTLLPHPLGSF